MRILWMRALRQSIAGERDCSDDLRVRGERRDAYGTMTTSSFDAGDTPAVVIAKTRTELIETLFRLPNLVLRRFLSRRVHRRPVCH